MDYKRFISYLYAYVEGEKGINVGYIRCDQRQGVCRLTLNLQDRQGIEGGRYKVYLYKAQPDGTPVGYYLDEISIHQCCGELRKQTACDNVWNTHSRIENFDGVIVVYDLEHAYASQWTDEPMEIRRFLTYGDWKEKKHPEPEATVKTEYGREKEEPAAQEAEKAPGEAVEKEITGTVLQEKERQSEVSREEETFQEEGIAAAEAVSSADEVAIPGREKESGKVKSISDLTLRLMEQRPKLPDFENHEIYDCVRIEPNDIGLLEMDNWKLGVNSFLTHGYYNYKYLMLGKLRFQDGVVKAVLGVPGVFDNKEQYIAKIFGFDLFVPLKHTNVKTGNFGYWIVELV